MRSPRRSAMRAAAARGECLSGARGTSEGAFIVCASTERRDAVVQARERTQRLRLGTESRSGHHVLRLVEADPGKRAVQTILIGEVPAQRRRVAPGQLELREPIGQ